MMPCKQVKSKKVISKKYALANQQFITLARITYFWSFAFFKNQVEKYELFAMCYNYMI